MIPNAIEWDDKESVLKLLDQRALPGKEVYVICHDAEDVACAIENMTVRGAPAIGIAAAYGIVLAAAGSQGCNATVSALQRLARTRPTAVNLFWALTRMEQCLKDIAPAENVAVLLNEARRIHCEDIENNRKLGEHGALLLPEVATVLTHCNAGALATGGHGTALGVLRSAREAGKTIKIYADETRPLLQGARLTAWELSRDGFDVTLICDSMAASLMKSQKIDAVIVGADRIAANGDTANKIGTYMLAVLALAHKVPFYVAAPWSTLDLSLPNGDKIPIEERAEQEVRVLLDRQNVPEAVKIWNPAFDVTPRELITAIITERGVFKAPFDFNL